MPDKKTWFYSIHLILLIALIVRLSAAVYWESRMPEGKEFLLGDSDGYWQLASRIAQGKPYQYNSDHAKIFRTPGYPVLLAPFFMFWDKPPVLAARILGVILGVFSVWLIWMIALKLFDRRTAIWSAWLAAFYPGAIAISILVLAEALFVPLMLMQMLTLVLAVQANSKQRRWFFIVLAGVLNGVGCLTRPSWLLFIPFQFVFGQLFFFRQKNQWFTAAAILFVSAAVMTPWWIRNYSLTGKFVVTSLQTGTSLYDGLNPNANGASEMSFAPKMKKEYLESYQNQNLGPEYEFEYAFNELMKKRAIDWAVKNPERVGELAWIKCKRIWNPFPNQGEIGSRMVKWGIAIYFLPLVLLAVAGVFVFRNNYLVMTVCLAPAIYFTLLHMIFVGSIRYRQPPMMTLLMLSAAMLVIILSRFIGRVSERPDQHLEQAGS